jgi:hypothetical protein
VVDAKSEAYRDHEVKLLSTDFGERIKALNAKGASAKHAKLFSDRAARVVALVKDDKLADIEAPRNAKRADIARAKANLTKGVASGHLSDLTAERVQQALATLKTGGRALQTFFLCRRSSPRSTFVCTTWPSTYPHKTPPIDPKPHREGPIRTRLDASFFCW